MNKKIPWFYPVFDETEKEQVIQVLESNYINDGQVTKKFEEEVAGFLGCKHCIAVTSGTAAISLGLMALGIGHGDEVIVPDLTFIATANAVRMTGAKVKLVDIEPKRFTIDPNRVREAIGPRTKAIIPVDVNGRAADYESLEAICKESGLSLICDSAEALGSKVRGKYLGTFGDLGCFSFSANKTVSSGQGGMIATNNTEIYYRLKELKDQGRRFGGTGGDDLHPVIGYNFKYTNLQAAVALAQFKKIGPRIEHFRNRDRWYFEALKECPGIELPPLSNDEGEVRQWTDLLCEDRSRVETALKNNQIDFRPFWFPLHRQESYRQPDDQFEQSIRISKLGLWLPSAFDLTFEDAKRVSQVIRRELSQIPEPIGVL